MKKLLILLTCVVFSINTYGQITSRHNSDQGLLITYKTIKNDSELKIDTTDDIIVIMYKTFIVYDFNVTKTNDDYFVTYLVYDGEGNRYRVIWDVIHRNILLQKLFIIPTKKENL